MHSVEGTLLPRQGGSGETTSEEGVDGIPKATRHLAGKGDLRVRNRPKREIKGVLAMSYVVDFRQVSPVGLESSPVAEALAGLRANEARYFKNKYQHDFTVVPAAESAETLEYVRRILKHERDLELAAKPLETSRFQVENIQFAYVFYEDGLVLNVLYTVDQVGKRAVGFKLSEGMEVPQELAGKFKFARQKSKLAGTIRGSFFVVKGTY